MSKEARSKGACWTCKLRRKKCHEEKPACSACTSLTIPCFGYDSKPEWADGGAKQRAKEEELRIIIRELASLRRRGRRKQVVVHVDDSRDVETQDENLSDAQLTEGLSKTENDDLDRDGFVNGHSARQSSQDLIASANLETLQISEPEQNLTVDFLEYDSQANLLMHYLDVVSAVLPCFPLSREETGNIISDSFQVFPSQFPFYDPAPFGGGRGWLLLIILRTKPLYHAALSMA